MAPLWERGTPGRRHVIRGPIRDAFRKAECQATVPRVKRIAARVHLGRDHAARRNLHAERKQAGKRKVTW
jgi:hypothetical protein